MTRRTPVHLRIGSALSIAVVTLGLAGAAHAQDASPARLLDAPYVVSTAEGVWQAWSLEEAAGGPAKRTRTVKPGDDIEIPAVGSVPSFRVTLRPPASVQADELTVPEGEPLLVVADTHGEYEILVEMLQKQRVIDARLRWSFGRGRLVFLGDVFDRGANQTEILWLIYQLESEAARAGGGVHLVLGNHEAMVLLGDERYLNAKYARTAELLRVASYSGLFGPRTLLGQWLRTRPAVLRMNGFLCLHGGISREVVERELTLRQINVAVRQVLGDATFAAAADLERAKFIMGPLGPLWYRGYFADQQDFPAATSMDVDRILDHFGADVVLVGHTRVQQVTPLYGGRVIAVQVYPRRGEAGGPATMEALRIENGRLLRARIDGGVEAL